MDQNVKNEYRHASKTVQKSSEMCLESSVLDVVQLLTSSVQGRIVLVYLGVFYIWFSLPSPTLNNHMLPSLTQFRK